MLDTKGVEMALGIKQNSESIEGGNDGDERALSSLLEDGCEVGA